jgi:hypothetical protein
LDLDIFLEYLFNIRQLVDKDAEQPVEGSTDSTCFGNPIANEIHETMYNTFIFNRIIKNPIISEKLTNEQDNLKIEYKDYLEQQFKFMQQAYFAYLSNTLKDKAKEELQEMTTSLNKIHLLALGFQYCQFRNRDKVELIFNLFFSKGKLVKSDRFREFIFFLLQVQSRIYYKSIKAYYEKDKPIFSEEEDNRLNDWYSNKNILTLTDLFITSFFGGSSELIYDEVQRKFVEEDNNSLWIFYGAGVRSKLEVLKKA